MNAAYEIQPMVLEDYDEVIWLWQNTEGVGLSNADSRAGIERYLKRNPSLSFVARAGNNQLVGAVLCGHDGRRGYLYHLAIAREHRGRGVGRGLVERCLAQLAALRIEKCSILVFTDNALGEGFWIQKGWTKRADLLVMQKVVSKSIALDIAVEER